MRGKALQYVAVFGLVVLGSAFMFYSAAMAPSLRAEVGQITLYFADCEATQVRPEKRSILVPITADVIIGELIKGPQSADLVPTIPLCTRLLSLTVEEGVAFVNLSPEVRDNHQGGSASELMLVYSVVASLTELPNISEVQFLLEGKVEPAIWGHIDTSTPIGPDESFIAR